MIMGGGGAHRIAIAKTSKVLQTVDLERFSSAQLSSALKFYQKKRPPYPSATNNNHNLQPPTPYVPVRTRSRDTTDPVHIPQLYN